MAYKFNPITGKMDIVNSATEISDSVTITGETYEKHGNLKPQVLDHKPVNEVMAGILFADYPPAIAFVLNQHEELNLYGFVDETITIGSMNWDITKKTNPLATLVVQNIGNNTTETLIDKTFTDEEKNKKTQRVTYSTALAITANHTIKARVTDEQSLYAEVSRLVRFTYPMIAGAYANTNLDKITIRYESGVYTMEAVDDNGNDINSSQLVIHKWKGNNTIAGCQINCSQTTPLLAIITKGDKLNKVFYKGKDGGTQNFTMNKIKNITVEFYINGVKKWEKSDYALYGTRKPFTKDYMVDITFEPQF